jgi:hypothetical protein
VLIMEAMTNDIINKEVLGISNIFIFPTQTKYGWDILFVS